MHVYVAKNDFWVLQSLHFYSIWASKKHQIACMSIWASNKHPIACICCEKWNVDHFWLHFDLQKAPECMHMLRKTNFGCSKASIFTPFGRPKSTRLHVFVAKSKTLIIFDSIWTSKKHQNACICCEKRFLGAQKRSFGELDGSKSARRRRTDAGIFSFGYIKCALRARSNTIPILHFDTFRCNCNSKSDHDWTHHF